MNEPLQVILITVREHPILHGSWEVAFERGAPGVVTLVLFGGFHAKRFAEAYATEQRARLGLKEGVL